LDLTGLVSSIAEAALAIDFGIKGFATRGKAEKGRISTRKVYLWHYQLSEMPRTYGSHPQLIRKQ